MNNNTSKWSLEIVPRHVEEVHQLPQWVEEIYVTMIPGSDVSEVILSNVIYSNFPRQSDSF